jgi:hypothetical protein
VRQYLYITALFAACSAAALAEDWTGKLLDGTCLDQQQQEKTVACDATQSTIAIALDVAGKIYKFDIPTDPNASKEIKTKLTGTEAAGMILVDTIGLQ